MTILAVVGSGIAAAKANAHPQRPPIIARLTSGQKARETLGTCMDLERRLCASLLAKIHEQIERTGHLISLLPVDRLHWKPAIRGAWPVDALLGHLLDCLAGFCADRKSTRLNSSHRTISYAV